MSGQEVLLTGSTGFLGQKIVQSLIRNPMVERVHCIAISAEEMSGLPFSGKISTYTGNLHQQNLGLSKAEFAGLQSSLSVIIHAGSTGHCLNNYSSLRVSNLGSTRFLAALALPHRVPIHFISSNRVTLFTGNTCLPPVSVSSCLPNPDGSEGFTASKWASERLLEFAAELGLPVTIHRPCAVIGDEAPNEDVNRVADAITAEALSVESSPMSEGEHAARFVHHSSGHKVSMKDFKERMATLSACPFEDVSMAEWIEGALQAGIDPLITGYLEAMTLKGETIMFPYMGETL